MNKPSTNRLSPVSDELVAVTSWSPSKRRLNAVKACAEGNADDLIGLMNAYLSAKGKKGSKTSPATRKTYETGLLRWMLYCWPDQGDSPRVPLLRASEDDVEGFRTAREDAGNAPTTVGAYLAAVRTLYNALVWAGAVERSPALEVRSPTDPRPAWEKNSAMPMADYKRLLAHCADRGGAVGLRNAALIRLQGDVGLRIAEACALDLGDIDLERRQLVVQHGKGDKKRTVAMTKAAADALALWIKRRRPLVVQGERALILNVGKDCPQQWRGRRMSPKSAGAMLNRLYVAAGVSPTLSGAHVLRHTAGTRLHQKTGDVLAVARQLGHSNVNTSAVYAHYSLERMHKNMGLLDEDGDE